MMTKPLLVAINPEYFHKLYKWKNIQHQMVGDIFKVDGFSNYNRLVDINSMFSSYPFGELVDRTDTFNFPLKFKVMRPWVIPTKPITLEEVMKNRVDYYTKQDTRINVCWSGGIDSTSMLVAFLKHATNLNQLRILYSPFSVYENRVFYEMLQTKFPELEMMDISGNVYMDTVFDGIFVNGHGSDEFTASLDDSFYKRLGNEGISMNWKDFFYKNTNDDSLIDFCDSYFVKAGKPITSVLDARWWFYASNKSQVFPIADHTFLTNQSNVTNDTTSGFFDSYDFETYVFYNPEQIMGDRNDYKTYKNFLKRYIYDFDKNDDYFQNAMKGNSKQFVIYTRKKICMLDLRWIARLEDSTIIRTDNLPLLSEKEFNQKYGNSLDYLFNKPDEE